MDSPQPHDDLPAEMVEEILLYLPVKSLRRFNSVSKAWRSMISEAGFMKRYRGRGREKVALEVVESYGPRSPEYEMIFLKIESHEIRRNLVFVDDAPISCTSTSSPEAEVVVFPFQNGSVRVEALCDELWLTLDIFNNNLFLWNPSMRTYINIPNTKQSIWRSYKYGVGYDSVGDDYKILKISSTLRTAKLYSLRRSDRDHNGWRAIPVPFPFHDCSKKLEESGHIVCVSGNLHICCYSYDEYDDAWSRIYDLISFNLSSEKFGKVALPNYSPKPYRMEVLSVLRGKLSLGLNYDEPSEEKLDIWVMEEYGVATSWTKKFCIKHSSQIFRPLYFGENGELVSMDGTSMVHNAVYKDEESSPRKIMFSSRRDDGYIS